MPEALTLQACGGFLRGDVLHDFGAPEDDVEPGVGLKVQHPAGAEVLDGLLGRRGRRGSAPWRRRSPRRLPRRRGKRMTTGRSTTGRLM